MASRAAGGERPARRVLKVRHEVEKLRKRIRLGQQLLQCLRYDAVIVGVDGEISRLIGIEGLNRAEIRRPLEDDSIAGIEQHFSDQVESLLRAVDDKDLFAPNDASDPARQPLGNPRAKLGNTLGHAILKRRGAVEFHDLLGAPGDRLGREKLGCGQAAPNEMTSGCCVTLSISRIVDARR